MEISPVAAELKAWLVACSVGAGIVLAILAEIHLRQQEWLIDELRTHIGALERRIEMLKRGQR